MCKIRFEPLSRKSKHTTTTNSPPTSISRLQKQKPKAAKMSLPKTYCMSAASISLTAGTSFANVPDHYAIMQLDIWATTEEVKVQFRKLRTEYFTSDAAKYRQLQTAYAVLVDREARAEYDAVYRERMGLPPPTITGELVSTVSSSRKISIMQAAVSRIDAQASPSQEDRHRAEMARLEAERAREEEMRAREAEEQRVREEEQRVLEEEHRAREAEEQRAREEEEQRVRDADPNWHLKHFSQKYKPLNGSRLYHSFVPVAKHYERSSRKLKSQRPTYGGGFAVMAAP
ncbi:hypothetical protein BU23DRAFT_657466 [Bimuria novae-zelandiae CBS 107.79]|uniref:J domain-containing protein n=1 Tax=Bimuria novae-zelandiae CBS 107.79 TaxID=1447943 RepID=A0A6A5VMV6_9PLEO|nr:hypothetical protein BU23DRAFT_657466 [Bimuria novae-zelandiae CBS 107.79]